MVGLVVQVSLLSLVVPYTIHADAENMTDAFSKATIVKNGRLTICKIDKSSYEVVKKVKMMITAYSSSVDQTDSTPFTTASGKTVEDGIIANNMLPFGTKVRIPELYGKKVFVVEDRMHKRKGSYHADIWFESYKEARDFGAKVTYIEVLES